MFKLTTPHNLLKKSLAVLTAIVGLCVISGIYAPSASAASSISCGTNRTYGWIVSPVGGHTVGARYCKTMTYGALDGLTAYWFKPTNGSQWIPTSNNKPNSGGTSAASKAHAKAAKKLAAKYGVKIAFTTYTGNRDSKGYVKKSGVKIPGTYYPSPKHPGKGLIELSNGGNPLGAADATVGKWKVRSHLLDTLRHEAAHARIELKCGTWNPPIAGGRIEPVTDAFAVTYFGKKRIDYKFTDADVKKAKSIAARKCE